MRDEKYVEVTHTFVVGGDITEQHIANIVSTMTVQAEEPVIGYDEHQNEQTTTTCHVTSGYKILPMQEVMVLSWVYWNGDEQGGGGFNWWPADVELDWQALAQKEADKWGDSPAIVRITPVTVPYWGISEEGRQRVTDWIDSDIDMVEGRVQPHTVVWNRDTSRPDTWLPLLKNALDRQRNGIDIHEDELTEIQTWMRRWPDEVFTRTLAERFAQQWEEVQSEPMHWAGAIGEPQCPEYDLNSDAWTTGDTEQVTCESCKGLIAASVVQEPDAKAFLLQNTLCAATLTVDDLKSLDEYAFAEHHSGGLIVLGRPADNERDYIKMHDSWGDEGKIVVHMYDMEGAVDGLDEVEFFDDAHLAYLRFLQIGGGATAAHAEALAAGSRYDTEEDWEARVLSTVREWSDEEFTQAFGFDRPKPKPAPGMEFAQVVTDTWNNNLKGNA